VRVVASVVDASGHPIPDLQADELVVSENGKVVKATVQRASQILPVALAFVIDASGSMSGPPLQQAVAATTAMVRQLAPDDRAALVTFREQVQVVQPLTADKNALVAAAGKIVPAADTPLASWPGFYEALRKGAEVLSVAGAGARSAIVLVTDGFDRSTTAAQRDTAIAQARSSAYPIDAIAVGRQLDKPTFQQLADASGGIAFFAPTPADLAAAYQGLSEELLSQYSLSYRSEPGAPGQGRNIQLRLVRAGSVLAETAIGYSVPTAPGTQPTTIVVPQLIPSPAPAEPAAAAPAIAPPARSSSSAAAGVALLGGAAFFSLFLFAVNGVFGPGKVMRVRLDRFVPAAPAGGDEGELPRVPLGARMLRAFLAWVGQRLARVAPSRIITGSATTLEQAGSPLALGPVELLGLRAAAGIAGGLVLLAAGFVFGIDAQLLALLALGGLLVGYLIPGMLVRRLVTRRKKEILRVLPSTLDMIALSVEAGLAFDGAIAHVAQRRRNALADEFRRLLVEFQMGRQRRDALREVARRCGVPEVARFINAVMQADTLGAPLSRVLGSLAMELRTRRRQRAEELARTAPIKMLFPMVGLIFPALFVVILGPAAPRILALFKSVSGP
jgi:tight adherence protein C